MRKACHRGLPKVGWQFTLAMAAYNLVWPAEVAGGGGVMPGVCPERTDGAKKSLKLAWFRRRQR